MQRIADPDLGFGTESGLSPTAPHQPRGLAPHRQRLGQLVQASQDQHLPPTLVDYQANDACAFEAFEAAAATLPVSLTPLPPTIERRRDASGDPLLWEALGPEHKPRSTFKHKHRKHRSTDAESSLSDAVVPDADTQQIRSPTQPDRMVHRDFAPPSSVDVASSMQIDETSSGRSNFSAVVPADRGSLVQRPSLHASDVHVDPQGASSPPVPAHMDLTSGQTFPTAARRRRQSEVRLPLSVETDAFTPSREARSNPFAIATEADRFTPATPTWTNSARGTSSPDLSMSSSQSSLFGADSGRSSLMESSPMPPTLGGSMDRRKERMQASLGQPSKPMITADPDESLAALIRQVPTHKRRASVSSASPALFSPMASVASVGTVTPPAGVNPPIPARERRGSLPMMAGGSAVMSSPALPPAGFGRGKAWSLSSENDQGEISVSSRHAGTLFAPSAANDVGAIPAITSQRPQRTAFDPAIPIATSKPPVLRSLSHAIDDVLEMRGDGGSDDEAPPVTRTAARPPPVVRTLSHTVDEVLDMRREMGFDSPSSDDDTGAVCAEPQPAVAMRKKPIIIRTLSAEISDVLDMAEAHGVPSMAAKVARSGNFMGPHD